MADNTVIYDNLEGSGEKDTLRLGLGSSEILVRGQACGYNHVTGKIVAYNSAGSNGAEVFYGLVMYDVSYTSGDRFVDVYVTGRYNSRLVVFANPSVDSVTQALINAARILGIILKPFLT